MAAPTLVLGSITSIEELQTCSPYLMPFHIDYSGQAPISTYLRVEPASETVGATPQATSHDGADAGIKVEVSPDVPMQVSTTINTEVGAQAQQSKPPSPSLAKRITDVTTRFISSFRGRTIHGLKVDVPAGYVGVVLKADGVNGQSKGGPSVKDKVTGAKMRGKRRATRSAATVINVDDGSNDQLMVDEDGNGADEASPRRVLSATSQFPSFVLWHADIPVDDRKDEYSRALTEWIKLAHHIHKVED